MESQVPRRKFIAYPRAIEGPKTSYTYTPGSNPVLSGISLAIAGSAAASIPPLASFLWNNAGFGALRKISILNSYEPRYDPTVIPTCNEDDIKTYSESSPEFSYDRPKALKRRYAATVGDYHAAYKAGQTTPIKVAEVLLDLIEKDTRQKVAFLTIKREDVLAAAKASAERYRKGKAKGILDGVPVGIKDEVDLKGHSKSLGSTQDFTNPKDVTSWCVRKWEEAGAVVIGKLNMHEFGLDTCGNNPNTGTPQNPHNARYYPGGSSSASATTVASNLLPLTLGCDGGGSIRVPSAYCGIYGLKTSHGRVGRSPSPSMVFSTSVIGPMAGYMSDLEIGYRVMAARDPDSASSALFAPPIPQIVPLQQKVIGICKSWFDAADPVVLELCHEALAHYQAVGYQIIDIDLPCLHEGQIAHAMTILAEARAIVSDIRRFSPSNRILLAVATQTPAHDFLLAQKLRNVLMTHLSHLFTRHPGLLIVTPTTPNAGWPINSKAELTQGLSDANMSVRNMTYVWLANFTGCPAISIPIGKAEGKKGAGNVPVGLMAMAEWGDEERLLEWGMVGERWAWGGEGDEQKMKAPEDWIDVLELAKQV